MFTISSRLRPVCVCAVVLAAAPAVASSKQPAAKQEGTLVSFADVPGSSTTCSGGAYTADCQTSTERRYTVRIAGQQLTIMHILTRAERRRLVGVGIWKTTPNLESVLAHQLPGFTFQAWSDNDGLHLQSGDKESLFQVVGASATPR